MKITPENVNTVLPKDHEIKVFHFHDGNDPGRTSRRILAKSEDARYATLAVIYKRENSSVKHQVGVGTSRCHPKDTPNKRLGWQIAAGRAFKDFQLRQQGTGDASHIDNLE